MARVTRMFILILLLAVLNFNVIHALSDTKPDNAIQPLELINITPKGEDTPPARQITFKFNRPVVPVSRMERDPSEIPIVIIPEIKGQWRWLNTKEASN